MAFRRSDLQEAFFVPGTQPFRARLAPRADHQDRPGAARAYGTSDPLEEVLAPGYFKHARGLLRPGELIYVSTCPGAPQAGGADHRAARMALVMVRADERDVQRALGSVRLVQDFGRPGDPPCALGAPAPAGPDVASPPAKRGRGRPPGSRTKKPA